VFEKGEKTTVPPHRPGIDLGIDLEVGQTVPIQKIYALSYDQLEELYRYIKQNEKPRMDSKGQVRKGITDQVCQEKGPQTQTMRRLSGAQRSHQEGSTPATTH